MTTTDLLGPDARARIERACKGANSVMAAARADADRIERAWMESRIQPDMLDLIEAKQLAESPMIAGRTMAREYCFDAMVYEHFLTTSTGSAFEVALEDSAAEAINRFAGDPDVLRTRKQQWVWRARGRVTLQDANFQRTPQSFWHDLRTEFGRLDGADLRAILSSNGWWLICGGPPDPAAKGTLCVNFECLVRRAVAALGFCERLVAVEVWLDALKRESPHAVGWGIDHLCFACQDYCVELERRSEAEVAAGKTSTTKIESEAAPEFPARDWDEVEILFFNELSVRIRVGQTLTNREFGGLGMADKRSGKPTCAWLTLHDLALANGVIARPTGRSSAWRVQEKRMQEIRSWLRSRFGLQTEPLPFSKGVGYQARFKINCARSYRR